MKKIISIAFAAILAGLAISCQKEELVSEKTDAVQYTFNITVNDQVGFDNDASTKGGSSATYKSAWDNGDKIFLFFKPTSESLLTDTYATLTYNGSSWVGTVTEGQSSLGNGGTLSAVFVYKLGSSTPSYLDSKWTIATGNTFYNCQTGVSYTISGNNEISATLNLVAPADFVQFYVGSATGVLTCDKVKGWKDVAIGSDMTVSNVTCTGYMEGFTNGGDSNVKEYYGRIVSGTSLKNVDCEFSVVKNGEVYERTAIPSSDARSFSMNTSATGDKAWTKAVGKLSGLFSVEAGKLVRFSKGNLYYNGEFQFEKHQYDSTPTEEGDWTRSHISHFFWDSNWKEATAEDYYSNGLDVFFTNEDETTANSDFTVGGGTYKQTGVWRTLSKAEWQYLLNDLRNEVRRNKYKYGVTVCGKTNCVVLLPDNWNESIISLTNFATQNIYDEGSTPKWSEMEAAGAVCLPAAGWRGEDEFVDYVDDKGYYWSSSASSNTKKALCVEFTDIDIYPANGQGRNRGHSVRLVTDVK